MEQVHERHEIDELSQQMLAPNPVFPVRGWRRLRRSQRGVQQQPAHTPSLTRQRRTAIYQAQNQTERLTPKQVRRINHKQHTHHARTSVGF